MPQCVQRSNFNPCDATQNGLGFLRSKKLSISSQHGEGVLYQQLIQHYKQLEKEYDFVLCDGIYSDHFANIVELDINIEIAKNFSSAMLGIINGFGLNKNEVLDMVALQNESMKKGGIFRLSTIINKADANLIDQLKNNEEKLYVIPYVEELSRLSLSDIIEHFNPIQLRFDESSYIRKINNVKVAAMGLDNYLEKISQGDLVIFPADRSEIILGLLGSYYSKTCSLTPIR